MAIGAAGEQSEWRTKSIAMKGGMRFDLVPVLRDNTLPGSLIDATNFETGEVGGYRRVFGYDKFDTTVVPGSGRILGAFVFGLGVVACRDTSIYFGTGYYYSAYSGWGAAINPTPRTGAGQYRAHAYHWSTTRIALVDGVNYPMKYDGTTATDLTNAPQGATCVCEYNNSLFFGKGSSLYGSDTLDDTTYSTGSGGFELVVGDTITGLRVFRNELYIFCNSSIGKLSGTDATTYVYTQVTSDIGCTYPDTIQEMGGDLYFLGPDGIRTISATARIGDVNLAAITNPIMSYLMDTVDLYASKQITSTVIDAKSQYRLFFGSEFDTTSPGIAVCLGTSNPGAYGEGNEYEFFKLSGFQVSCADHGVLSDGRTQKVIHGGYDGYIYQQESGNSFNGSNISASLQLPYLVFDDPALRKVLYKLRLYVTVDDDAIANLTAQIGLDDNDPTVMQPPSISMTSNFPSTVAIYGFSGSLYGQARYGQGAASNYLVNPIGAGYNISITISSSDTLPSYTLRTAILTYGIEARQ
jgi:hypothetical protein